MGFSKTKEGFRLKNEEHQKQQIEIKNENTSSNKVVSFVAPTENYSTLDKTLKMSSIDQQILGRDHQKCNEKYTELIQKFKEENEDQQNQISEIKVEKAQQIAVHQEIISKIKGCQEVIKSLNNKHSEKAETISSIKREIAELQKRQMVSNEYTFDTQNNFDKMKKELAAIKIENSEMRKSTQNEKTKKDEIWNQLREQSNTYQDLLTKNSQNKEVCSELIIKIENLQSEMRELKQKNHEALKKIQVNL